MDPVKALRVAEFLGAIAGIAPPANPSPALRAALRDPRLMADHILPCFLEWLEAETSARPVIVIVEDLHWGDLPSVQLLDNALRTLRDKPLLVLGLARPEVSDQFPHLFRERNLLSMNLGPLHKRAAEKLVEEVLGDRLGADERRKLVERSDGNPFFLEELMRAVAEGGAGTALPDSVLGMVHSRLDALGDQAKQVLRAGSVFGEVFREGGVRALLGGDRCRLDLADLFETLIEKEVIFSKGGGGSLEFVFRHALVRDAAYALLTEEDRCLGHALAGAWLVVEEGVPALVLAEHFERGQVLDQAIVWYRRASDKALEANDLAAVIGCAERGIACGASGDILGELVCVLADAHQWRGEDEAALRCSRSAMAQLPTTHNDWFRAAGCAVTGLSRLGMRAEADSVARQMLALGDARTLEEAPLLGMAAACLHTVCYYGDVDLAESMLAQLKLQVERAGGIPRVQAWIDVIATNRYIRIGDLAQSLRLSQDAVAQFREGGDLRNAAMALINLGAVLLDLGAYSEAAEVLREVLVTSDRLGLRTAWEARVNLGMVLGLLGAVEEGCAMEQEVIRESRRTGDARNGGAAALYLARILLQKRDFIAAEREARAAIAALGQLTTLLPAARAVLALALLRQGKAKDALASAKGAFDALTELGAVDEGEMLIRRAFAETLDQTGERSEACRVLKQAHELLELRAAKISDESLRRSFIENVADHADILTLRISWGCAS